MQRAVAGRLARRGLGVANLRGRPSGWPTDAPGRGAPGRGSPGRRDVVEAEWEEPSPRVATLAGQHFLRRLAAAGTRGSLTAYRSALHDLYPLEAATGDDPLLALAPGTPVLATTATANERVTADVAAQLGEQTVTLREEAVEVERRPSDRKLKAEEAEAAFQEKTVEMLGTSEEAEVSKEARVVGEVSLGKRVEECKETVKDTVRRTQVEVEKIGTTARKSK